MNNVIDWLKANAEFLPDENSYCIEGGYCDSEIFGIVDNELISVYWSDEYGQESFRHLTVQEFTEEYIK